VGRHLTGLEVKRNAELGTHARSLAAVPANVARAVCRPAVGPHANRDGPCHARKRRITTRSTRRTPASRGLLAQAARRGARALALRYAD
jgi:hypothetical protein